MALIKCPECGRENVSDTATSCPQCGFNVAKSLINDNSIIDNDQFTIDDSLNSPIKNTQKSKKKRLISLFLCAVFFILIFVFGNMRSDCKKENKKIITELEEIEKADRRHKALYTAGGHYSESEYREMRTENRERKVETKSALEKNKNKSVILLIALISSIIAFGICILLLI